MLRIRYVYPGYQIWLFPSLMHSKKKAPVPLSGSATKNISIFNTKILYDMIPDTRSGFFPSHIQGSKKAQDHGSATLIIYNRKLCPKCDSNGPTKTLALSSALTSRWDTQHISCLIKTRPISYMIKPIHERRFLLRFFGVFCY